MPILLSVWLWVAPPARAADDAAPISANPRFTTGTAGWRVSGYVHVESGAGDPAQHRIVLGPGAGSIAQTIPANGRNHMMLKVVSTPSGLATVSVRCLDKDGLTLMTLRSPQDIRPGKDADSLEDYFRPHPLTASIELVISKGAMARKVAVTRAELDVYHDDDPALTSRQDDSDLMRPFWEGSLVSDEAVLLTSHHGRPPAGTLMFQPTSIVSVASYDGRVQYREGTDFSVVGRTLTALPHSRIGEVDDANLLRGELAWNELGGRQVLVTYEHTDAWTGAVQPHIGDQLPRTLDILRRHGPLRIVAYGDSITYGIGSSHMQKIAPYQPPWIDLFAEELRRVWNDPDIALFNASQSGADSIWARAMADRMVGTLHPDLVIVAFGQNDFWSLSADAFAENISAALRTLKQTNPQAEFLLVSTMRFDPAYSSNPTYWDRVTQYQARLRAMTTVGVQLVDMTAISGAVFAAKEPRDCLNDPLHPNDYLSRWYAQSMLAALTPDAGAGQVPRDNLPYSGKKGVGDDDPAVPQAIDGTRSYWYYNWTPRPSKGAINATFVPMIWGAQSMDADLQAAAQSGAKDLLTFNEPDSQSEANLTVDEAIALWPKLEATGLRLGSPATTTGSPWLDQFMAAAKAKNLRVDFLCLHWYGDITAPDPVGALQKYLQGYWDRYHLPVWLTEYSGADFSFHLRRTTVADNVHFAAASAAMMENLPFVERFAWFGTAWTPESKDYPTSGLYNNATHALSPVGAAWRDISQK